MRRKPRFEAKDKICDQIIFYLEHPFQPTDKVSDPQSQYLNDFSLETSPESQGELITRTADETK